MCTPLLPHAMAHKYSKMSTHHPPIKNSTMSGKNLAFYSNRYQASQTPVAWEHHPKEIYWSRRKKWHGGKFLVLVNGWKLLLISYLQVHLVTLVHVYCHLQFEWDTSAMMCVTLGQLCAPHLCLWCVCFVHIFHWKFLALFWSSQEWKFHGGLQLMLL